MFRLLIATGLAIVLMGASCGPAAKPPASFRPGAAFPIPAAFGAPTSAAFGDVTGDGRPDLLITYLNSKPARGLLIFPKLAVGGLGSPRAIATGSNGPDDLNLVDLDGDHRLDVVALIGGLVTVFYQRNGTLAAPTRLAIGSTTDVAAKDMNRDGRTDIVILTPDGNARVYLQQADHRFIPWPFLVELFSQGSPLAVGDVDGNGRQDVLANLGDGYAVSFGSPSGWSDPLPVRDFVTSRDLAVADVSNDGRDDVVRTDPSNTPNAALIVSYGGGGTFRVASLDVPVGVTVADVNGDARNDVLVAHANWNALGIYTQTASGGLSPETLLRAPLATFHSSLAVGDVNGDGKSDVVHVTGTGQQASVFYQR